MKILITGINGFVGKRLSVMLNERAFSVRGTSRIGDTINNIYATGDISGDTDWREIVSGCDAVIHTAGRAHILHDKEKDIAGVFRRINYEATKKLAEDAYAAGVKQFIFISSIGVIGENTQHAISEKSVPHPVSDYAISKYEAEQYLLNKYKDSQMAVTIIRPALICGPGAPGNIERLLKLVASGLPLPFKNVRNARSMASLDNVCDFIIHCIDNSLARNEVFVISDEAELTIEDIVKMMAAGMRKKVRLIYIPTFIIKGLLILAGKKRIYEQLYSSFKIDATKAKSHLKWQPITTIQKSLFAAGKAYNQRGK